MRKRRFWMMWVGYVGAAALWYASVKWFPINFLPATARSRYSDYRVA